MSLKKFRGKQDFIDYNFDYDLEYHEHNEYDDYWNFDYWDCDYCGRSYCQHYSHCSRFDYIDMFDLDWLIKKSKRGGVYFDKPSLDGFYINMDSIYKKEVRRDIKIDILLGLRRPSNSRPTLGDIINKIV